MKNVIVFGGAGFLGSHVADALSDQGYNVTIFDISESKYLRNDQKQIIGDILDLSSIESALKGQDIVYHLAGIADIDECHKRPLDTVRLNILGTANILESSVRAGVKKIVFASSAYVYSESGSFYRVSKQSSEQLVETYAREFGLNYVILRYGSLYGPRADQRNSIHRILNQALKEKKITYGGDGSEKREFIHVLDAARLSVEVLDDKFNNENIILTGNSSIKYQELLETIKEMLHDDIEVEYVENKSENHYRLTPYSFSPKLGKKLVNNPHIDLGQGLLSLMDELH